MIVIQAISAFNDNYIWIICQGSAAVVVDPGDAKPVKTYLEAHQLKLRGILVTHHHGDHVGGVAELVQAYGCPVFGPSNPNLQAIIDNPVREGDQLNLSRLLDGDLAMVLVPACESTEKGSAALLSAAKQDASVSTEGAQQQQSVTHSEPILSVLEAPGHTMDHIAYFGIINTQQPVLFCGDTLFSCGCGRLFEGDSRIMLQSLDKFKKMPQNTLVYCAHEYTLSNIKWALAVEPHNEDIHDWQERATQLRAEGLPTVPTSLGQELKTNPFLRVEVASVRQAAEAHAGQNLTIPADVLGALREWKNTF